MKCSCTTVILFLFCLLANSVLAAVDDAIRVDASQEASAGILDVSALSENLRIANADSLTQIITASGQAIHLDGLEVQIISEANGTLTISGNGSVDVFNSSLSLPDDGSVPTVANLLSLEFEGLAASNSLVPQRLTVEGSHGDAIAAIWIQLDQLYVGANDFYNLEINRSFVHLGNDYARFLSVGGEARLDIVKVTSERLQTLHDNLLGNLGDGPVASRFTNIGEPDPRTTEGSSFGERPYHSGTVSAGVYADPGRVSSIVGWDLLRNIAYPSSLPSPFAVLNGANHFTGTAAAEVLFPGDGDDVIDGGSAVDTVTYSGEVADYSISSDSGRFIVADKMEGRDGTDSLRGVEKLHFIDGSLVLAGGNDFTIQEAIEAASSGDTVIVAAGTYAEALIVNKSLVLVGEQAGVDARDRSAGAETIIEGSILVKGSADSTVIDGFSIREGGNSGGEYAGIFLASGASGVVIRNSIFSRSGAVDGDGYRGILTTSGGGNNDLLITRNRFSGWATGAYLNPLALDAVVSNNLFDGNFVGMSVDGPSNTQITGNQFSNNEFEGVGIGPGVDNPTLSFSGNSFQLNATQLGIYTPVTLDLSTNSFDTSATIGPGNNVYATIQAAIDAASDGDTIQIGAGIYRENVAINKPLSLSGVGASTVISPTSGNAIAITGNILAGSDGSPGISDVAIENMAIIGASGSFGIIALSNAVPAGHYDTANLAIRNVGIDASAASYGIGLFDVIDATIEGVTISGYGYDSLGAVELVGVADLAMTNVNIDDDALSLNIFEVDGYAPNGNVVIRNSSFRSLTVAGDEAVVDVAQNWWGTASGPSGNINGTAIFDPWYIDASLSLLSDVVIPDPVDPEPDPVLPDTSNDAVEDLVDGIVIDAGDVSEEVLDAVSDAADAAGTLAENIVDSIDDVAQDTAIDALLSLGKVAELSGRAAGNSGSSGNTEGAESAAANGSKTIDGFAKVLTALDTKVASDQSGQTLTTAQKTAIQDATTRAVSSAVQVLQSPSQSDARIAVLKNLGAIVSSSVNLGVTLSDAESETLFNATESVSDSDADLDDQLEASIPLRPKNKALVSKAVLGGALQDSGVTEEELDGFLRELSEAINPADVNIGGLNGQDALDSGLNSALQGQSGTVDFDASTGVIFFSLADEFVSPLGNVEILALTSSAQRVPARVVSTNIVSKDFPGGIRVKADGSVVITDSRIASIVVPASIDPISLYADIRKLGFLSTTGSDGNVVISNGNEKFSATFDFVGVVERGAEQSFTSFSQPTGLDESDPDYLFFVNYRNGNRQALQPFVAADNLINSLKAQGVTLTTDRNSGILASGSYLFRPSYFVTPLSAEDSNYWQQHKDAFQLAYRVSDANGDGRLDFSVLSGDGAQIVYALAP